MSRLTNDVLLKKDNLKSINFVYLGKRVSFDKRFTVTVKKFRIWHGKKIIELIYSIYVGNNHVKNVYIIMYMHDNLLIWFNFYRLLHTYMTAFRSHVWACYSDQVWYMLACLHVRRAFFYTCHTNMMKIVKTNMNLFFSGYKS